MREGGPRLSLVNRAANGGGGDDAFILPLAGNGHSSVIGVPKSMSRGSKVARPIC